MTNPSGLQVLPIIWELAAQHREALISVEKEKEQSLLTKDELEISAIESVLRMVTRKDMISKLGKPIYSFTLYEKVKRATILLQNSNNSDYPSILMVSFENNNEAGTYQESIILNGILLICPSLQKQLI
ncbi:MAG: hypothetical protein WCC17_20930 [Candidatus Nitrosopolaris sp.]